MYIGSSSKAVHSRDLLNLPHLLSGAKVGSKRAASVRAYVYTRTNVYKFVHICTYTYRRPLQSLLPSLALHSTEQRTD